jgi:hypothetical protein
MAIAVQMGCDGQKLCGLEERRGSRDGSGCLSTSTTDDDEWGETDISNSKVGAGRGLYESVK